MGFIKSDIMGDNAVNDLDQILYTDYPEFEFEYANVKEPNTLPPESQTLVVGLDKRKMDGAPITYITGFVGRRIDLRKSRMPYKVFAILAVRRKCTISC